MLKYPTQFSEFSKANLSLKYTFKLICEVTFPLLNSEIIILKGLVIRLTGGFISWVSILEKYVDRYNTIDELVDMIHSGFIEIIHR